MRLVLATANLDKAREIAAALSGFELVPRPLDVPDVAETADTLEGNARLKRKPHLAMPVNEAEMMELDGVILQPGTLRDPLYLGFWHAKHALADARASGYLP